MKMVIKMEIYLVRHGDPDYERDSLTGKGVREAKLLAERLAGMNIDEFYCSPLGRALKTASYTLNKVGKEARIYDWLREFEGTVKTGLFTKSCCWDRLPSYWTGIDDYYSYEKWHQVELMKKNDVYRHYKKVCDGMDALLAEKGYVHNGRTFTVERENSEKIVLFCHFGVESVIPSHLLHISPMLMWHNFVALPSSVTRLATQEREKGTAVFTCIQYGDLSHLYAGGEEPSFQARFCEKYSDDTRH